LAQAATFGLVAVETTPIINDNTDIHAKITNANGASVSPRKLSQTKTPGRPARRDQQTHPRIGGAQAPSGAPCL
jgi:hypothetical protein